MSGLVPAARLILPVLVLLTLGFAGLAYEDVPARWLGAWGGLPWFNTGLVLLPVSFFAIHLTGRRYGPFYALWQVVAAWTIGAGMLLLAATGPTLPLASFAGPPREIAAFAVGLIAAQLVAVAVFDRLRGPQWWQAPLFASLFAGLVLCLIAFPAAYAGTAVDWVSRMASYMEFIAVASVVTVLPYWMLRGIVPPLSGFGGY